MGQPVTSLESICYGEPWSVVLSYRLLIIVSHFCSPCHSAVAWVVPRLQDFLQPHQPLVPILAHGKSCSVWRFNIDIAIVGDGIRQIVLFAEPSKLTVVRIGFAFWFTGLAKDGAGPPLAGVKGPRLAISYPKKILSEKSHTVKGSYPQFDSFLWITRRF